MDSGTDGAVYLAVELSQAIHDLPAVATVGWCDQASAIVGRISGSAIALTVIATLGEHGRIRSIESSGAAAVHSSLRATRLEGLEPESLLTAFRERASRLSAIGWIPEPESVGKVTVGVISSLPGGRNWRMSPAGKLWSGLSGSDPLVGLAPLGGFEQGRVVMVQIMPMAGGRVGSPEALVLSAVLPQIARRALTAFGPLRSSPNQWLTPREKEVLDRLILGRSVKEIAADLGRSQHTMHDHVKSLHRKLNARSRGELIARALGHIESTGEIRAGFDESEAADYLPDEVESVA